MRVSYKKVRTREGGNIPLASVQLHEGEDWGGW